MFTNFPGGVTSLGIPQIGNGIPVSRGKYRIVGTPTVPDSVLSPDGPVYGTIQAAVDASGDGDVVIIAQGEYDEQVTITQSNITLFGMGGAGAVAIAPSAANPVAMTIDGTDGEVTDVQLINVGCAGDGTGGGLLVTGDVSRFRAYGCKFEGGAYAAKLLSTVEGAVGDVRLENNEFAWTTSALIIDVSGGGDPVTQVLVKDNLFHNFTTDGIVNVTTHTADLWVVDNTFANQEDGTEPTQYLDIDIANTTGLVAGNVFATTVLAAAKLAIAAGVIWAGNQVQAEGPATGGGTSGRPD